MFTSSSFVQLLQYFCECSIVSDYRTQSCWLICKLSCTLHDQRFDCCAEQQPLCMYKVVTRRYQWRTTIMYRVKKLNNEDDFTKPFDQTFAEATGNSAIRMFSKTCTRMIHYKSRSKTTIKRRI